MLLLIVIFIVDLKRPSKYQHKFVPETLSHFPILNISFIFLATKRIFPTYKIDFNEQSECSVMIKQNS